MLKFFGKWRKVFLVIFMVGILINGINICLIDGCLLGINFVGIGIAFIIVGWLITVLAFSIAGSFLVLNDDVEAIQKKLDEDDSFVRQTDGSFTLKTNNSADDSDHGE
ncbi:MAG: hypothetical protein J1F03_01165 [Oscillospiraceae bacterium]|nr:hypothetical protein [Oscillospiraceae bacterium]